MSIKVFYNEIDPYCCAWLSNLMDAGHIRPGTISDKSITELSPQDVVGYDLAHFFAGIAGWDLALTLAGWRFDGRVTWTGSCPCQPFSSAARGRQIRREDNRHLWPIWKRLIAELRPGVVFGEQTSSAGDWFDVVCDDMEAMGYSIGASVLPACSVGLDHARARIYFAGHAYGDREPSVPINAEVAGMQRPRCHAGGTAGTYGVSARVGRLRAFGNAIVPQLAAAFVRAAA